ncbi:MAG: rhodanese-like domain-containing protein, partial [Flavobacteriaceae bacterium]
MDLSQADWVTQQETFDHVVILDVRTPDEFESGHIPKAQ